MLRNLVVPAVLVATAMLSGCQAMLKDELPTKEIPQEQTSKAEVSDVTTEKTTETEIPVEKPVTPVVPVPPKNIITIEETVIQKPAHFQGRLVLGLHETATLPNLNLTMDTKLDTGAEITSADARNIQLFERDKKRWVKFELHRTSKGIIPMELPVRDIIRIRRPGSTAAERPTVNMTISTGEITQQVEVSLTDRSNYDYPLLIGRNLMQDLAVVDVSQSYVAEQKVLEKRSRTEEAPAGKKSFSTTVVKPVSTDGLETFGAIEGMQLPELGITLKARIDTGALTSSLDARDIDLFKKNGASWARFKLPDSKGELIELEHPITRFLLIKRHGLESERRAVITIPARIGNVIRPTQFSLRSRESYEFPILVGVRFLEDAAIVDVSKEYITGTHRRDSE